jgi:hypothetical protein
MLEPKGEPMAEAGEKTDWLATAVVLGRLLLLLGGGLAGLWYLWTGGFEGFSLFEGPWRLIFMVWGALVLLALASGAYEQLGWYGPLPVAREQGYAWRRSIRSRLQNAMRLIDTWPAVWLLDILLQALARQDWGRTAVAALLIGLLAWSIWLSLRKALGLAPVFTIDDQGLTSADLRGGAIAWDRIDRIVLSGDLEQRRVTLMTTDGQAMTLELAGAGISARRFLALVEDLAPQVEIQWPAGRIAAFA